MVGLEDAPIHDEVDLFARCEIPMLEIGVHAGRVTETTLEEHDIAIENELIGLGVHEVGVYRRTPHVWCCTSTSTSTPSVHLQYTINMFTISWVPKFSTLR